MDKYIKLIRVLFAFLLGVALMIYGFYGWYSDEINDWQALIVGLIGFVFAFLPDKLQEIVGKSLNKIFNLTIGRFFGTTKEKTDK